MIIVYTIIQATMSNNMKKKKKKKTAGSDAAARSPLLRAVRLGRGPTTRYKADNC